MARLATAVLCAVLFVGCASDDRGGASSAAGPDTAAGPGATLSSDEHEPPVEPGLRFALFGDSLASETQPFLEQLATDDGDELIFRGFPGTAICDFLPVMETTARERSLDAVVLLFTGNSLTPCIVERTGVRRGIVDEAGPVDVDRFVAAYRSDAAAAIATFDSGVPIVLVGVPPTRGASYPAARALDELYRTLAREHDDVRYLAIDETLTPEGEYRDTLPCLPDEPCAPDEPVPVRAPDGGHLCPPSPAFCFGGSRMATMIHDAVHKAVDGAVNAD